MCVAGYTGDGMTLTCTSITQVPSGYRKRSCDDGTRDGHDIQGGFTSPQQPACAHVAAARCKGHQVKPPGPRPQSLQLAGLIGPPACLAWIASQRAGRRAAPAASQLSRRHPWWTRGVRAREPWSRVWLCISQAGWRRFVQGLEL
jgi:hypothetical protein